MPRNNNRTFCCVVSGRLLPASVKSVRGRHRHEINDTTFCTQSCLNVHLRGTNQEDDLKMTRSDFARYFEEWPQDKEVPSYNKLPRDYCPRLLTCLAPVDQWRDNRAALAEELNQYYTATRTPSSSQNSTRANCGERKRGAKKEECRPKLEKNQEVDVVEIAEELKALCQEVEELDDRKIELLKRLFNTYFYDNDTGFLKFLKVNDLGNIARQFKKRFLNDDVSADSTFMQLQAAVKTDPDDDEITITYTYLATVPVSSVTRKRISCAPSPRKRSRRISNSGHAAAAEVDQEDQGLQDINFDDPQLPPAGQDFPQTDAPAAPQTAGAPNQELPHVAQPQVSQNPAGPTATAAEQGGTPVPNQQRPFSGQQNALPTNANSFPGSGGSDANMPYGIPLPANFASHSQTGPPNVSATGPVGNCGTNWNTPQHLPPPPPPGHLWNNANFPWNPMANGPNGYFGIGMHNPYFTQWSQFHSQSAQGPSPMGSGVPPPPPPSPPGAFGPHHNHNVPFMPDNGRNMPNSHWYQPDFLLPRPANVDQFMASGGRDSCASLNAVPPPPPRPMCSTPLTVPGASRKRRVMPNSRVVEDNLSHSESATSGEVEENRVRKVSASSNAELATPAPDVNGYAARKVEEEDASEAISPERDVSMNAQAPCVNKTENDDPPEDEDDGVEIIGMYNKAGAKIDFIRPAIRFVEVQEIEVKEEPHVSARNDINTSTGEFPELRSSYSPTFGFPDDDVNANEMTARVPEPESANADDALPEDNDSYSWGSDCSLITGIGTDFDDYANELDISFNDDTIFSTPSPTLLTPAGIGSETPAGPENFLSPTLASASASDGRRENSEPANNASESYIPPTPSAVEAESSRIPENEELPISPQPTGSGAETEMGTPGNDSRNADTEATTTEETSANPLTPIRMTLASMMHRVKNASESYIPSTPSAVEAESRTPENEELPTTQPTESGAETEMGTPGKDSRNADTEATSSEDTSTTPETPIRMTLASIMQQLFPNICVNGLGEEEEESMELDNTGSERQEREESSEPTESIEDSENSDIGGGGDSDEEMEMEENDDDDMVPAVGEPEETDIADTVPPDSEYMEKEENLSMREGPENEFMNPKEITFGELGRLFCLKQEVSEEDDDDEIEWI